MRNHLFAGANRFGWFDNHVIFIMWLQGYKFRFASGCMETGHLVWSEKKEQFAKYVSS